MRECMGLPASTISSHPHAPSLCGEGEEMLAQNESDNFFKGSEE